MVVPLWERLPEIESQIAKASHLLVLLDYDGTLTPLVDRPEIALLDPRTRLAITTLAGRPITSVAILSGRALEDVKALVGIDGLIYAGNHGLEIKGPGIAFVCPDASAMQVPLQELARDLAGKFRSIAGVLIENKCLTLSIHYRLVPEDELTDFCDVVSRVLANLSSSFHMTTGNKVHEIRPRVAWNKGTAALWIRQRVGIPDVLPIYLGDDRTDEDAFVALQNGITVKVGNAPETAATYSLTNPAEACQFLDWLARSDRPGPGTDAGLARQGGRLR